jgi:6-pyruvoyltetrahydropterin/6-carboxytetrahydropterin synthase
MIIGKTFKFEAAHCLPGHEKCGKVHGHTYKLTVEVEGSIDPVTGMLMDYHELANIVKAEVIDIFDHRYLNDIVVSIPTCERLAVMIFETLDAPIRNFWGPERALKSVTLQEGEGGYARKER